jgi:Ca2+-binding RTX toxin-like protein
VLMGATNPGVRQTITRLDQAMLADIGYQIAGFQTQGFTPAIATSEANLIFGTDLADTLDGLAGNDQIQGNAGSDFLNGGEGDDVLFGQADHDTLVGQAGNDQLVGGEGNDFLIGDSGNDTLFGGTGRDIFQFGAANGADAIGDFVAAEDTIQVAAGLGFSIGADVLRAITSSGSTQSGGLFSIVTLSSGNTVTVFHDAPLTAQNFAVA